MTFCSVILDSAIDTPLDYQVPENLLHAARPGVRVLVPLRKGSCKGILLSLKNTSEVKNPRLISEILSEKPILSEELFSLARWMAHYYCCPLRKVLKSLLPPSIRKKAAPQTQLFVSLLKPLKETLLLCQELRSSHPLQAQALETLLSSPKGLFLSECMEKSNLSRSPIDSLIKKGILSCSPKRLDPFPLLEQEYFRSDPKHLNAEQAQALSKIKDTLDKNSFETHLLYGVTGSGKTEVYLQAIAHALSQNKTALLLVPEIALTSQTLERLKSRFSQNILLLHHRLSEGERKEAWHRIFEGNVPIVVGARSALFSPLPRLGLIIVDEEHESSYKQTDDSPCYHARDVAVVRGKFSQCAVVLGSATPSLESYHNAQKGKYILSHLGSRVKEALLPTVQIVDMKQEFERAKGFTLFSELLLEKLKKRLELGEQSLLFLNRRGYHTSLVCSLCAHVMQCPHCDISLTFHLGEKLLACHLCDYRLSPPPATCPSCRKTEGFQYKGAGTEKVEGALRSLLPEARILRLDADTTRRKGSHELLFKQFRSGKADILIGTQMIAKGLHFPTVTLVGVLNADASLQIPDFRASESVFQLLTQVSGRAGRGSLPGEVIIQSHLPNHETILLAARQDYEQFYRQEIEVRKLFGYPPFTHLVKLTFFGENAAQTCAQAETIRNHLIQRLPSAFELHPVIPCGHAKRKDNYRFQFLIKAEKLSPLSPILQDIQNNFPLKGKVRFVIDVDPLSTYF